MTLYELLTISLMIASLVVNFIGEVVRFIKNSKEKSRPSCK